MPTDTGILANDFSRQWEDTRQDVLTAVERVGASGWYVLGEEVRSFEAALANVWGLRHCVGVANGLDALEIGLRILGCKPGDRVLTTPLSAFATTLAIVKLGAVPVFCDTDDNGLIDLVRCHDLLRNRRDIRYFVPVHLYGHPLDPQLLWKLRTDLGIQVLEDCAQSAGACFDGKPAGSAGQIAATSFYPTKNLGGLGDGGALLTNDSGYDAQARILRFYGETARYSHEFLGYNSRLDELQAAILLRAQFPRLPRWVARRQSIAAAYLSGIQNPAVRLPQLSAQQQSSWHLFPVFVAPTAREAFLRHMKGNNIGVGVHYPKAIPDQPVMKLTAHELADDCTIARRLCASEVSIPIHPYLKDEEVARVIEAVNTWK
jgi:dTDP-3-amino-3,4,6-trideoxy-alpha-D-glucose transaminase